MGFIYVVLNHNILNYVIFDPYKIGAFLNIVLPYIHISLNNVLFTFIF